MSPQSDPKLRHHGPFPVFDPLLDPLSPLSRCERDRLQTAAPSDVFRQEGTTWQFAFNGQHAQLPNAEGLHDIATLLRSPGHETERARKTVRSAHT